MKDRSTKFISVNISKVTNHENLSPQKLSAIRCVGGMCGISLVEYSTNSLHRTLSEPQRGLFSEVSTSQRLFYLHSNV